MEKKDLGLGQIFRRGSIRTYCCYNVGDETIVFSKTPKKKPHIPVDLVQFLFDLDSSIRPVIYYLLLDIHSKSLA